MSIQFQPSETGRSRRLIRDLPLQEQPLYRLNQQGSTHLSDSELLALIFGHNHLNIAQELIDQFGDLHQLARAGTHFLLRIKGLGPAQAARWQATVELSRRLRLPPADSRPQISCPADAAKILMPLMQDLLQEEMRLILLDTRGRILGIPTIYKGSLNTSVIRIGELFRPAIEQQAAAIIVAHNHPRSDPQPSTEDVAVTRQIIQASKILDIPVMDHIVIGTGRYVSLKERGLAFGER